MDWGFLFLLVLYLLTPVAIFVGRNWIKTNIERSVEHKFNERIEAVRSELRKNEEEFKGELRTKEGQIAALRDGVLTGRAQRQALVDKRRLEAIEKVWAGIKALTRYKALCITMGLIKFDVAAKEAVRSEKFREVMGTLTNVRPGSALPDNPATNEQPFVSPMAWAYFSAYETIVLLSISRAQILQIGIEDPQKFFSIEGVSNLTKTVLPHHSEYIDRYGPGGYYHLMDELETRLLTELQNMLSGQEQDQASVAQSATIMTMVRQVTAGTEQAQAESVVPEATPAPPPEPGM